MNTESEQGFELETSAPVERHTPVVKDAGARDPAPPTETRETLAWALQPGFLLFLGALLLALAWLGYQNPVSNVNQEMAQWPWNLFRAELDRGGDPVFLWDRYRAVGLGGAVLALLLLVVALLPGGRWRSATVFAAAGAAMALFWRDLHHIGEVRTWAIPIAAALVAGAIFVRDGVRGSRAGAWILFGTLGVLGGLLFFPLAGGSAYDSTAFELARPFQDLFGGSLSVGFDRLWSTDGLTVIGLAALFVLGLLSLFGLRGPWTAPVAAVLVLLTAVAPPLANAFLGVPLATPETADLVHALAAGTWILGAASGVLLLAGVLSLLRLGGAWTVGVAGGALAVLALVVASRAGLAGLEAGTTTKDPFFVALSSAALWLGPGLGAFLLPLAAAVVDRD